MLCRHDRIYTAEVSDQQTTYIFLMCKKCGVEIARWKKPEHGMLCFEELLYQHMYVFGPPPELSWAVRHELR
jgi:hypothetical protein